MHPDRLKYKKPFTGWTPGGYRRSSFNQGMKGAGVYVIRDHGVICYIGMSRTCIGKTAYRHFQSWNDRRQYRVTYSCRPESDRYTLAIFILNPYQAMKWEDRWIRRLQPRDNRDKMDLFEREKEERYERMRSLKKMNHNQRKKYNHKNKVKPKKETVEEDLPF